MDIAIDIGNSNVVIGIHDSEKAIWSHLWRIGTHKESPNAFKLELTNRWFESALPITAINNIILCSVVPPVTDTYLLFCEELFQKSVTLLDHRLYGHLDLKIHRPQEIGADLVANAYGAMQVYRRSCLIVDFGTALTMLSVRYSDRTITGASIAPGIETAFKSLFINTAQLPEVPVQYPPAVGGQNTIEAIQSGVLIGYEGLVSHLAAEYKKWANEPLYIVGTGGLSGVLTGLQGVFDVINPTLTLDGLMAIAQVVSGRV